MRKNSSNGGADLGQALVDEFAAAITNLVTMETARYEAARSEQDTIAALEGLRSDNGLYLTPDDIPAEDKDTLVRRSLDAHLKKVQSEQISSAALNQVNSQQATALQRFKGKKMIAQNLGGDFQPFEAVWYDKRDGSYRTSAYNPKSVKGTIEDISFERNLLVLKTTYFARLLTPSRPFILIHVINTKTLAPAVIISI